MLNWIKPKADVPAKRDELAGVPHGPEQATRHITNIFGKSGEGKTTLLVDTYRKTIERGVSGTFLDTTGTNRYVARAGFDRGAVCGVVTTADGWLSLVSRAAREKKRYNIVVVPESVDLSPNSDFWRMLLAAGNSLLACDDAEEIFPSSAYLDKTALGKVIAGGRHAQLSMLNSVRVPPELHKRLRSVADVTISFRQEEPDYVQLIGRRIMESTRAEQLLTRLPKFNYLRFHHPTRVLSHGVVVRSSS